MKLHTACSSTSNNMSGRLAFFTNIDPLPNHRKPIVKHKIQTTPSFNPINAINHESEEDEDYDDAELLSSSDRIDNAEVSFESVNHGTIDSEEKCSWLRSQLIGDTEVDIPTPFGTRALTYADHTASGRSLYYIESFIIENALPFYGNTHTEDSYVGHRTTKMVREAARYVKRCMGGGPGDALLFCGSGTTAAIKRLQEVMGIAVPSTLRSRVVKELRREERWVVFVGPYEHHSNLLSWRESLADVVEIGVDGEGLVDVEMLRGELESGKYLNRPMLGSFSACSNVTGIVVDTRGLARVLHEHGAFACFDFAASGPYVQIDLRSGELDGYDAVFLSPHKFVGGPGTTGILLMSKTLYKLRSAPPSTCGGGTVRFVNGYCKKDTLYFDDIEEREDSGTPAIIPKIRAALAFSVKEYMGYPLIESRENLWAQSALRRLLPNPNIQILGNTSVKRQPILSFLIPTTSLMDDLEAHDDREAYVWREGAKMTKKDKPLNCRFVTKLLNDLFGIQARGGCACAGPYAHFLLGIDREHSTAIRAAIEKGYNGVKPGWTRISFAYYMSTAEFEFILAAIEFIAQYGQQFLPLYHFNWRTGDWTFRRSSLKNVLGEELLGLALDGLELGGTRALGGGGYLNCNKFNINTSSRAGTGVEHKYKAYLETARYVAQALPKFPPRRRIPKGINPDIILFKI